MPAVTASPHPATTKGLEDRLRNLERLRREGVIGQAEYRERRMKALQEAFD